MGTRVGRCGVGEKNIMFLSETFFKLRFLVLHSPSSLSTSKMTGGPDVRGKVSPIWVGKVFNCLRSL
jgi:hypothetical protein